MNHAVFTSIQANFLAFFMLKQCADILLSLHTYKQVKIDISYHYILEKLQLDLFMWIVVTPV